MIIIVAGTIGQSGVGGQGWATMQYLAGFRHLGHDVYYLEDCGETSCVFDWEAGESTFELDYPAAYIRNCLGPLGFGDRWIYRAGDDARGMSLLEFRAICAEADLLIMRATPMWTWRPEYALPRRRIFIDVDPAFTQFTLANGNHGLAEGIDRCERLFTIGQRIGAADCPIPTSGREWLKTLPPVSLTDWPYIAQLPATHFTSVVRWKGFREETYEGVTYGQRDKSFPKYLDLPRLTSQPFCVAALGFNPKILTDHGWNFVPGETISRTPASYQQFIQQSRGEFSVPKHAYVSTRSGWFSDRSVCYLASGRPVAMENTGLDDWLPTGEGLVTFSDENSAAHGIDVINDDYARHCRGARRLAEEYFATERVLPPLLDSAMS